MRKIIILKIIPLGSSCAVQKTEIGVKEKNHHQLFYLFSGFRDLQR